MKKHIENGLVRRVMVGTDRSDSAEQAVHWAASFAEWYVADLLVVQVIVPQNPASTEFGAAERTRAAAAGDELTAYTQQLAGERGHAFVVVDADPALAIVRAAEQEVADVLVVGNMCMAGRKEFLLGNVPNRISHNARCTVIIVNTLPSGDRGPTPASIRIPEAESRLLARGAQIATVMAKHGLKELFGRPDEQGATGRLRKAKRLRAALDDVFRQTGRRLALGLTAAASILATGLTAVSTTLANWVPATFGVVGGLLTFGLIVDVLRRRCLG